MQFVCQRLFVEVIHYFCQRENKGISTATHTTQVCHNEIRT